jgi:tRNA modification GTPase
MTLKAQTISILTPKNTTASSRERYNTAEPSTDFICALSTPGGSVRSAIGVIRATGKAEKKDNIFEQLEGFIRLRRNKSLRDLTARVAYYAELISDGEIIDDVVFIKFDGPASYTGEDSFEIHAHGNPLIIRQILAALYARGFRPAEPGEFTRRAYLNGKLDIDSAQAVAEIIEARNGETLRAARRLKSGQFRKDMLAMRSALMNLLADLNAELDFIEEDISFASMTAKLQVLGGLRKLVTQLRENAVRFESLKSGVRIAIIGPPNAGKSSLMNRILGEDRSIVSDVAGTTRDYIETEVEIAGFNARLIDTAGLHDETTDQIERMGIERTKDLMLNAHLCIILNDGSKTKVTGPAIESTLLTLTAPTLQVVNKSDIIHASWRMDTGEEILISARTGEGVDELLAEIGAVIQRLTPTDALPLNLWQLQLLGELADLLERAQQALEAGELPEVISHVVGQATARVADLTGEIHSEDILGRIFSRFCIGK